MQAHAASAKAGVDALSATTALEYGPRGITSNVITPGPIAGTEGMERLSDPESAKNGKATRGIPLGRYGTVKEIADATVYLFSDTGSYVNGDVLVVDGGSWYVLFSSFLRTSSCSFSFLFYTRIALTWVFFSKHYRRAMNYLTAQQYPDFLLGDFERVERGTKHVKL